MLGRQGNLYGSPAVLSLFAWPKLTTDIYICIYIYIDQLSLSETLVTHCYNAQRDGSNDEGLLSHLAAAPHLPVHGSRTKYAQSECDKYGP